MDHIDEYKQVEEDQQQGKGKSKVIPQDRRDFREPMHQVLEKIKNESYFKWPNKIGGDPMKRNQSLHCQYHQERGHTTEDCKNLWNHLEQLVRDGKLKKFLHQPSGQSSQAGSRSQRDTSSRPSLGTINVILVAPRRTGSYPSRVMFVTPPPAEDSNPEPKRAKMEVRPTLSFLNEDKVGTLQPHDDALVVTLRIEGYDVKRVLVDQGSGAEIMYPDLYNGLNLKPKDLTGYDSPLLGFDGKVIVPNESGGAKCEKLEKNVIDDDSEKFFKSELSCLFKRRKS
ncbi:uncharacterized protein LOC126701079 [Quercus robur]|uniref:uncharacterized protein LOC126701079 n=1 Tax=Quercus robur TaxID=38942 RepID=UPI0021610F5D|nr:uncharacterized protein LOC126701079 [Quercus robur]